MTSNLYPRSSAPSRISEIPACPENSRIFTDGYIFRTAIASSTPFIPGINMSDKIRSG